MDIGQKKQVIKAYVQYVSYEIKSQANGNFIEMHPKWQRDETKREIVIREFQTVTIGRGGTEGGVTGPRGRLRSWPCSVS